MYRCGLFTHIGHWNPGTSAGNGAGTNFLFLAISPLALRRRFRVAFCPWLFSVGGAIF